MAKVNQSSMKQWADGQTMHGPDYNQERDLMIAAYNDTQEQVEVLKGAGGVGTNQIQDNAVTTAKINNGAVTLNKLGPLSVDNSKLIDKAVTGNKIQDSTITSANLSNNIVTTAKLVDSSVTTDKIAPGAITLLKMGDNSIKTSALINGAVITSKLADDAVDTPKILDGAVSTDKIMYGAITPDKLSETYYTATQTDEQISTALSGGLPQEVIDQIIDQVADITSGTVNTVPDDSIMPTTFPASVPLGTYVMRISAEARQNWNDSTYFGYPDVVPVLLRTSHAGDKVVQEIFYQGPGWNVSYKRVSMSGDTWTGWRDEEDTLGAQAKADAALASAKTYTQAYAEEVTVPAFNAIVADGYIPKGRPSNLIPNSSAELGLQNWANIGTGVSVFTANLDTTDVSPGMFTCTGQTTSGVPATLQSNNISISSGALYTLSADFYNSAGGAGQINVRLVRVSDSALVATLSCDSTTAWHRKSLNVSLSLGTYILQVYIPTGLSGASRRVRRLTLASGINNSIWNQDANDKLLFQSVSDGKALIAGAISGKNVPTSASDSFQTMATNIGNIQQGAFSALTPSQSSGTMNLSANQVGIVRALVGIPANAKTISGHPANGSSNVFVRTPLGNANGSLMFALVDADGRVWQISPGTFPNDSTKYTLNMYSLQIDLVAGQAYSQCMYNNLSIAQSSITSSTGYPVVYMYANRPAGFDTTRDMQICAYILTSYTGGTWTVSSAMTNFRIQTT